MNLALEIMKGVLEAEKEAENIRQSALRDAENIRIEANERCKRIILSSESDLEIEINKLKEAALESAKPQVESIMENARAQCEALKEASASKQNAAIEAIIRKVVVEHGNC